MTITFFVILGIVALSALNSDHIQKFLEHSFKLRSAELKIKELEAQAILLKLKADPNYQEREDFVKNAIEAHKELS